MKKFVEIKSANVNGVYEVVANKGVCWQVQDEDGGKFLVQKKQVVRGPWEEPTEAEEAEAEKALASAPPTSLLGQLNGAAHSEPAKKERKAKGTSERKTRERDPNVVTLKELCADLNLEPRIARRRLRGGIGHVGTGARWEWVKDSEELAKVRKVLAPEPQTGNEAE